MTDKTTNQFNPKVNLSLGVIVLVVLAIAGLTFWLFKAQPSVPEIFVETAGLEVCESTFSVNCPYAPAYVVNNVALSGGALSVNPCATVTVNWTETPAPGYQRYYSLYYEVLQGSAWINRTYIKTRIAGNAAGSTGSYQWKIPETLKGKTIRLTAVGYDNATGDPVCVGQAATSANITVSTSLTACVSPSPSPSPSRSPSPSPSRSPSPSPSRSPSPSPSPSPSYTLTLTTPVVGAYLIADGTTMHQIRWTKSTNIKAVRVFFQYNDPAYSANSGWRNIVDPVVVAGSTTMVQYAIPASLASFSRGRVVLYGYKASDASEANRVVTASREFKIILPAYNVGFNNVVSPTRSCITTTIGWTETPAGRQRYYSLYYKIGSSAATYLATRIPGASTGGGTYKWTPPLALKGKDLTLYVFGYDNATGDPVNRSNTASAAMKINNDISACPSPSPSIPPTYKVTFGSVPNSIYPCQAMNLSWTEAPGGRQRYYSLAHRQADGTNKKYFVTRVPGKSTGGGGSYEWRVPEELKGKSIKLSVVGYDNATGTPLVNLSDTALSSNIGVQDSSSYCDLAGTVQTEFDGIPDGKRNFKITLSARNISGWSPQIQLDGHGSGSIKGIFGATFSKGQEYDFILQHFAPFLSKVKKALFDADSTGINFGLICTGDLDGNNQINSLDWSIMKLRFGDSATLEQGDLNLDGQINSIDWSLMKKCFGRNGET